ncbi:unnamed protein product, partial [Bubo scandiacus]
SPSNGVVAFVPEKRGGWQPGKAVMPGAARRHCRLSPRHPAHGDTLAPERCQHCEALHNPLCDLYKP